MEESEDIDFSNSYMLVKQHKVLPMEKEAEQVVEVKEVKKNVC